MSYTQDDIDSLRKAIAKGVSQAKMGEEQVTFRSLAEMRSTLAEMEQSVNGSVSRQHYPTFVGRPE
ncbi:phage head-tail joining protein [Oceaniovalibus sp. ACAM 378]|uniref:phage head-tail joining protein n=1 Tax=Oceaniovalibus sp. ACAM 378 TaxID=2599923 RepID=UPI0011D4F69F|nr:hypothetical protein [Oceaniovalibus sp. ACAM 378]TYB83947.1 hypothetical protein FQ320_23610 [Oceaniovalibus sp. ACAM 378]